MGSPRNDLRGYAIEKLACLGRSRLLRFGRLLVMADHFLDDEA